VSYHEIPSGAAMPKTLGSYSNIVRAGDFLFVSGQIGVKPGSNELADFDFETEARQAFANLESVLRAAGSSLNSVVKITVCIPNADDFPAFNSLFAEAFHYKPPAQSCMIAQLPFGLRVAIDAVALA
jgi:2-iminobutanoate/2-iminopropanoate deaminase